MVKRYLLILVLFGVTTVLLIGEIGMAVMMLLMVM